MQKTQSLVLTLLAMLGLSATAAASPRYPEQLQVELNMPCVPQCSLCHLDNTGGPKRINNKFGYVMQFYGGLLSANRAPGVLVTGEATNAIRQVDAYMPPVDSDMDGKTDVNELREGQDPFATGDVTICGPQYGCGARIARQAPADGEESLILGLAVAAFATAVRRGKRRAPRRQKT